MSKKLQPLIYIIVSFSLLLCGFCFGFSDRLEVISRDIFGLGHSRVIAADPNYVPEMQRTIISGQIEVIEEIKNESTEPVQEQISVDLENPRVLLYCTHNAETYRPDDGVDKKEGQNAGIFSVAEKLCEELIANGISAILCPTIHDYPDWSKSYANSLASIKAMQEKYPSLEVFIDVHRDAPAVPINSTVVKGEQELAKIMLVVGSAERIAHPTWEQNHAFAQKIGALLEEKCSGILRGVKVQSGRYNQHISSKSILVEMGTNLNSLEQVKNSAVLLAEALSEILSE